MKIEIKCPECAASIEQDLTLAGTLCSCPQCHTNYTAPATNIAVSSKLGAYWIQSRLGGSVRSDVFAAKDLENGHRVVIKVFSPLAKLEESHAQRYFSTFDAPVFHDIPGIIQPSAVGAISGFPYIATDFLQGEDLRSRVKRVGTFPESQLVHVARSCAETLQAAWDSVGRYHGNIRPGNIHLLSDHQVVFIDFGLDLLMVDAENEIAFDPNLAPYRSPEQNKGERTDFRTDMYSLGATLYFLATGAKPLAAGTGNSLLFDDGDVLMPPICEVNQNVSSGFSQVVSSLLKVNKEERPGSWGRFLERIDDFQGAQLSTQIMRADPERIQAAIRARDAALASQYSESKESEDEQVLPPQSERRKKGPSSNKQRDVLRRAISNKVQSEEGTPGWVVFLLLVCILILGGLLFTIAVIAKS